MQKLNIINKKVMYVHHPLPPNLGISRLPYWKKKMKTKIREYLVCKYGAAFPTVTYFNFFISYFFSSAHSSFKFSTVNLLIVTKTLLKYIHEILQVPLYVFCAYEMYLQRPL